MSDSAAAPKSDNLGEFDAQPPDALSLAALICSRLCHDLINPVGALRSGVEVIDDESMAAEMKDAARDLVRDGQEKALALLEYARLAYGAAGGYGAEIKFEDARATLTALYEATAKAALDWRIGPGMAPKEQVKVLMILAQIAADCAFRGGTVTVNGGGGGFEIVAKGSKLFLNDDLVAALSGESAGLQPKYAPAYIAGLLARESGGAVKAQRGEDQITLSAVFGPAE